MCNHKIKNLSAKATKTPFQATTEYNTAIIKTIDAFFAPPPQNLNNNYLKVTKHLFIKKMEPEFDEALVKRRRLIKSSLISPRFAQPVFTWEFLPLTYIYIYSNFGRNIFKQNVNLIQHETLLISNVRGWFDKFFDIKPQKGRFEKKKERN